MAHIVLQIAVFNTGELACFTEVHKGFVRGKGWCSVIELKDSLVHGQYRQAEVAMRLYDAVVTAAGMNLRRFRWKDSSCPPEFTDDPGVAVVLVRRFASLQEERNVTWHWAAMQQQQSYWWPDLLTDSDHLQLQEGVQYERNVQWWARIRRTANCGKTVEKVSQLQSPLPGSELFAMYAQHPEVVRNMDGSSVNPYHWLGGLRVLVHSERRHLIPNTWFDADDCELSVDADDHGSAHPDYAVPEFLEK